MMPLKQLKQARTAGHFDGDPRSREDVDFMLEHWTPVEGRTDRYSCDQFDAQARMCRAQQAKPPVCRDYPWYLAEPAPERAAALPPQCSYLLDVPPDLRPDGARPLIPIEVIHL